MRHIPFLVFALVWLFHTWTADAVEGGRKTLQDTVIANSVVAVYDPENSRLCTGVLVSRTAVLTAAHCGDTGSAISIIFENHVVGHLTGGPSLPVSHFEPSPLWAEGRGKPSDRGDLALAILEGAAPYPYRPASLLEVDRGSSYWRNQAGAVAGYGTTSYDRFQGGGFLHDAPLTSPAWDWGVTELLVSDKKVATCDGDSGAPLLEVLPSGVLGVSALVSRGLLNYEPRLCSHRFGLTKLMPFREWIDDVLGRYGAGPATWVKVRPPVVSQAPEPGNGGDLSEGVPAVRPGMSGG
jgi:hypothetical protein